MGRDPTQIAGSPDQVECLTGILREQLMAEGSKFAHNAPVLRLDDGRWARLMVEGDNPFEHASLWPLLGQRVSARGRWHGLVLRVPVGGLHPVKVDDCNGGDEG